MGNKQVTMHALFLFILLVPLVQAQGEKKHISQDPCAPKTTCHECIQTPTCAWCSEPWDMTDRQYLERKRCFLPSINVDQHFQCSAAFIVNPSNNYTLLQYNALTNASASRKTSLSSYNRTTSSHSHEAVQIYPQRVSLKLRINEAFRFTVSYSQAQDYPVDLYYLMDLSKSMEDDKEKLSVLGDLLVESMQKITSDFRLGFGSFVDKVVMPYVSTVPKNLIEPCTGCAAPYGFRNIMSLSNNANRFSGEVRRAAVSGNLDAPEGGFDAIMQAVVCREKIGWREKARRLLVFSTDAGFHYAGDGKLGGIVKPNDGECHLDTVGEYTHSKLQDYPSISQVNLKVRQNAINVIFAVTAEQIGVYDRLKDNVEGASSGMLSNDSSNVVDLVREQYDKISSSVEMKDNATTDAVKVTYYSACKGSGPAIQTNKCDGLKVGDVVKFEAEVEVTNCPSDPKKWKQIFKIYPVGINESLIVDLEMLCSCPCEQEGDPWFKRKAEQCSKFGTYKCGICECDKTHFGRTCECDSDNINGATGLPVGGCRPDNTSVVDCSGRGTCVCGVCECETRENPEEVISGPFCECDNFSCDYANGLLCSGSDHGTCICGKCQCKPDWTGDACDCRASSITCIPPGGGEICSGNGDCNCGACECYEGKEGRYTGKFCEKLPSTSGRCLEFKECVQCQMYKTGSLTAEECLANCTFTPSSVDVIEVHEEAGEVLCAYYDEEDCRFSYVYTYSDNNTLIVRAQEKRECPPEIYVLGIVLGVIGAIVLIGLALLLLWKLLTTIHDRREFAKFEKERMMAKWDTGENPIYKQATSTFKNPTYAGK
ncbi:integrin beta-PS isoform X1 [Zootermopsis nevadensis]|uniref:integrin beta-PS isoform X1 n=1 Tax=Zootermopsis nevadensis TaxID=136037 RepID=UPI000B8E4D36|nr:integrin beta-PS isoform X1 [Zootermopsis nevadensis]